MKEMPLLRTDNTIAAKVANETVLRAYLARAMEYAGHQFLCSANQKPCSCGFDVFRAFLREQGVSDDWPWGDGGSMNDLVALARGLPAYDGVTHWEGCERDHRLCLIRRMADEIEWLNAVIAEQGAQIDSLQDRWASRPLAHADGEALIEENKRLGDRLAGARRVLEELGGMDCAKYDKYLDPVACGQCLPCLARAFLAEEDKS